MAGWYSNFLYDFAFNHLNKKDMAKDREGKFHPQKGQPSGSLRTDSPEVTPVASSAYEHQSEIENKYTDGDGEPAAHLHIRHRNRNVDKREDRQTQRGDIKDTKAKRDTFAEVADAHSGEEINSLLTKEKFAELAALQSSCCVTCYLPTHASGVDVNELKDQTAFKNVLQQITAKLKERNIHEEAIGKMLKPGYDLIRNDAFWRQLTQGLAVFISDDAFRFMKLPMAPKDELVINTSFYLSPLVPLIPKGDYFYVLMLSKKQAKFYRADAFGMAEIKVDELPNGVDDVVHFEEKDDQKLWRTGSSGAGGGANYHGIGAGKPDDKENLAMYFDEVDETLWKEVLNKENVPLLLAGVDYLIPIYKSVAKYKPIWNEAISGNQEYVDTNSLYEHARKIMEPYFEERHKKALTMYGNHSATELTSSIPDDVIPAAHYKRVWHLFVEENAHLWGTFDEMKNELKLNEEQKEGDEDMIDKAIIKTIVNGGEVHRLSKEHMPADTKIAALMRY
jgi:hypothetical protein